MEWTKISVKPGFSLWNVQEKGYEKPIAYFNSKEEAVKYAVAFARTKSAALLQILDERGSVTLEQRFSMERRRPAEHPTLE